MPNTTINPQRLIKEKQMGSLASALKLENVGYDKKGPIAYVTLNRPKVMNALNKATINELRAAFEDARDDSAVRGVILTGAGDKAFAAGADIAEIANNTAVEAEAATRRGQALTDLIEILGKPVIAAVNGFALGGASWRWRAPSGSLPRARSSASQK
jgi:enoyl-CoA hydratase